MQDRNKVLETAKRWYVIWVAIVLRQVKPKSPQTLSAEALTEFFQEISGTGNLANWQFRQTIDAIQILFAADLAKGVGDVYLPAMSVRKYPNALREWLRPTSYI